MSIILESMPDDTTAAPEPQEQPQVSFRVIASDLKKF